MLNEHWFNAVPAVQTFDDLPVHVLEFIPLQFTIICGDSSPCENISYVVLNVESHTIRAPLISLVDRSHQILSRPTLDNL